MAQKKAKPMWLARDNERYDYVGAYHVFSEEPEFACGAWSEIDSGAGGVWIHPAQSPVSLPPGGGPRKVRLATENEHAMIEAARGLVRNTKEALDIVASSYYDELVRLVEKEKGVEDE